ncbi:MAG: FAD-binding oxidoreductase, partial [Acidimicrobiia bacterium]|nr:FAD-binding oxidoreductase [Acidimicrobiia bacterium]
MAVRRTTIEGSGRSTMLSGWGRTAPSRATVYSPRDASEVQRLLGQGRGATIARGLGRSYGDAAQSAAGNVLDMTTMDSIGPIDSEAGTVTVDAG